MKRLTGAVVALFSVTVLGCSSPPDVALGSGDRPTGPPAAPAGEPPTDEPYLTGKVVQVGATKPVTKNCVPPEDADADGDGVVSDSDPALCNPNPDTFGWIHLKGNRADQGGETEIVVDVSKTTPVLRRAGGGHEPVAFDQISKGGTVTVWVSGPVMESYPLQASADFVLVK